MVITRLITLVVSDLASWLNTQVVAELFLVSATRNSGGVGGRGGGIQGTLRFKVSKQVHVCFLGCHFL